MYVCMYVCMQHLYNLCFTHVFLSPQVLTDVLIPATMQEMPERFVTSASHKLSLQTQC